MFVWDSEWNPSLCLCSILGIPVPPGSVADSTRCFPLVSVSTWDFPSLQGRQPSWITAHTNDLIFFTSINVQIRPFTGTGGLGQQYILVCQGIYSTHNIF